MYFQFCVECLLTCSYKEVGFSCTLPWTTSNDYTGDSRGWPVYRQLETCEIKLRLFVSGVAAPACASLMPVYFLQLRRGISKQSRRQRSCRCACVVGKHRKEVEEVCSPPSYERAHRLVHWYKRLQAFFICKCKDDWSIAVAALHITQIQKHTFLMSTLASVLIHLYQ